jgi:uncharacterized protein (DUF2147 family)
MKRLFACAAILAFVPGTALAADPSPIGDWMVKEGYAVIRIDNCAGKMWGIVAWEKAAGKDIENPDPAKKGRPILGMPILLAMAPTKPNRWEGEIYNSNNGKIYSSNISMANENTLKLEGCVLGFLCGGENWTRVTTPPAGGVSLPQVGRQANLNKQANSQKKGASAQSDVCARVASETASSR